MSEILFSYESSPSFVGPFTARGCSVTVYADGSVSGCGVFSRMKKETNLKNLQLAERIMQILDSHKQELEEIPELLDTRVMDGSILFALEKRKLPVCSYHDTKRSWMKARLYLRNRMSGFM